MWESGECGNLASIIELITIGGSVIPTHRAFAICAPHTDVPSERQDENRRREQGRFP